MDTDDLEPKSAKLTAVKALTREDISSFSVHELEERLVVLEAEIARAKEAIKARQKSHAAAQAVFGKLSKD